MAAQTQVSTSASPRVILSSPASGPIVLQAGGQLEIDPQLAAAMQMSGVDQTVIAQSEFDPPIIRPGERATYRVVVTAMVEGVSLPDKLPTPPGIELAFSARGFSYGSLGGALQPRTTLNYRVTVTAPGQYVVPAFVGSANGRPVTVPAAPLTVVPAGTALPPRQVPRLLVEVPPGEFYIGEAVPVSVVLLDPGDNSVLGGGTPQVTGDAFITDPVPGRYRRELRNDRGRIQAAQISDVTVIPLKEGRQSFTVQEEAFWNHAPTNGITLPGFHPLLESEPVTLAVKHLPQAGELPGFTGGIGAFRLDPPRLSTNLMRAGQPITLSVTVRGEGNLTRLLPPVLAPAKDWQVFPPVTDATSPAQIQQSGTTQFTYTLIPLSDTTTATPSIPFSYFNPQTTKYVDLTVPPVPVKVLPPLGVVAEPSIPSMPASGVPPGQPGASPPTLSGLATAPGRVASNLTPVQERAWFLELQLIPAAVLGALWAWDRRRRHREAHPEILLRARARRGVRRQLRLARRAAAARDARGFVAAAVNALREVCAPRAAANPGALVCADVLQSLTPGEREGQEGRLVRTLFAANDEARFLERTTDGVALMALQPELEQLLAKCRERW